MNVYIYTQKYIERKKARTEHFMQNLFLECRLHRAGIQKKIDVKEE